MFNKAYGYVLKHLITRRGYWGRWYYKARYEKVLEYLSKHSQEENAIILDLGCGYGVYANYLTEIGCKCFYVGCDIDINALRDARRGFNIDYVLCDIHQLPFKERSAQLVLCSEVLEHLVSPYKALLNICKTTSRTLLITFPKERVLSAFRDRHPEHVSEIDEEKVVNLLISRKFKLVQISYIFNSFIPCGILEFFDIPRNRLTQTIVGLVDKLLKKIIPSTLVPHKTILIEAKRIS